MKITIGFALFILQLSSQVSAGTKFASHVSINTPARSFTHGVGDPLPMQNSRNYKWQSSFRSAPIPKGNRGYPRVKPTIPFTNEDVGNHENGFTISPWQYNNYMDITIPLLPPSPYKVDSPDPESLWPEGLLLPSFNRPRYEVPGNRRSEVLSENEIADPYLLEGSEAIAAVKRASDHGPVYFHEFPHIESLLVNQELRVQNNLKPHRIASIRHTWPYNRP